MVLLLVGFFVGFFWSQAPWLQLRGRGDFADDEALLLASRVYDGFGFGVVGGCVDDGNCS